ncbi:SDR family oxidoreductase [Candidatus Synechococcus calcipolaris G9]|uniref:SDR family oxidoreductase n=1 Tax=Candidatus Synechococcus calcipolaris G9 TaxID=1497997 RepID=A0ABT6F2P7_9SYNE|nr:SDR family oxidoreductase [Candidatus Synechococcus calcipolaris]MDG2992056.1 SDR family oxidoreductase [Candidatus Synechococcus calcipolaris G9]
MPTALITGASKGIGAVYAQVLAEKGYSLVLTARSYDHMQTIVAQLGQTYGVPIRFFSEDLSQPGAAQRIYDQVQSWGLSIDLLINNAGFGDYGEFAQRGRSKLTAMIQVNILALMELTHLFLPQMQQRGQGSIINLSSIGGFQAVPYLAVYGATKAFVLQFSEALWAENRQKGVTVMAVCPGPTTTDFFHAAEMKRNPDLMTSQDHPEIVVRESLAALEQKRSCVITGQLSNRLIALAGRFAPREWLVAQLEPRFRPPAE